MLGARHESVIAGRGSARGRVVHQGHAGVDLDLRRLEVARAQHVVALELGAYVPGVGEPAPGLGACIQVPATTVALARRAQLDRGTVLEAQGIK
jgi:hypothetical protein